MELVPFEAASPEDLGRALDAIGVAKVEAVNVLASPFLQVSRPQIIAQMRDHRLPAIYQWPESAEDGGLLAYGPRQLLCYRHVISLVDKVLRGAKPADLPIEQPSKFELAVNLKTERPRHDDPTDASIARRRGDRVRRRDFIALIGGAAAWPLAARAQQPAMPVIGLLSGRSPKDSVANVIAFQRGLSELGYFDGQNVEIDFRWALGHYDQLPPLAADLVRRKVTVIVATGGGVTSTRAAMAATSSIPIIFVSGGDPIDLGLVESLNKPGGNLTGVTFFLGALEAKRLELLHELLPKAALIGALVNPTFPVSKTRLEDAQAAAQALGKKLVY